MVTELEYEIALRKTQLSEIIKYDEPDRRVETHQRCIEPYLSCIKDRANSGLSLELAQNRELQNLTLAVKHAFDVVVNSKVVKACLDPVFERYQARINNRMPEYLVVDPLTIRQNVQRELENRLAAVCPRLPYS